MAIFSRIADILKANINDMLDKAEDPEKMVKQIILEMEEQVNEATQALGQAMGSQKMAYKQLTEAQRISEDWNNRAKIALKAGNEDLARRALDSKVNIDAQVTQLQESYNGITTQVDKLRTQVTALKNKLEEARARQNILIARSKMADATQQAAVAVSSTNTQSAFGKLDKLERQVAQKEATAEAFTELNTDAAIVEDEFADLTHNAAVDSEMERLKAELGM